MFMAKKTKQAKDLQQTIHIHVVLIKSHKGDI